MKASALFSHTGGTGNQVGNRNEVAQLAKLGANGSGIIQLFGFFIEEGESIQRPV